MYECAKVVGMCRGVGARAFVVQNCDSNRKRDGVTKI